MRAASWPRAAGSRLSTLSTGKLRWVFYTIPGPGEPGHETWPADNDAWKHGGASIWQTPALDPAARTPLCLHRQSRAGPERLGARG